MPAPRTATRNKPRLILASASPRRLEPLRQIGIEPDAVMPAEIDERARRGEKPGEMAARLAEAKARAAADAVRGSNPEDSYALVLGADTVVACGRRILPKAGDEDAARRALGLLSGRRHRVYGGVCVIDGAGRAHRRLVVTAVAFKRLDDAEIDDYIASGEWRGKAGAYAIQGRAAGFTRRVNGSYSNVVGLPLFETRALLRGLGLAGAAGGAATQT